MENIDLTMDVVEGGLPCQEELWFAELQSACASSVVWDGIGVLGVEMVMPGLCDDDNLGASARRDFALTICGAWKDSGEKADCADAVATALCKMPGAIPSVPLVLRQMYKAIPSMHSACSSQLAERPNEDQPHIWDYKPAVCVAQCSG